MSDLETRLRDHFADRTRELPTTGPGLDAVGSATNTPIRRPRYGAITLIAAASIVVLGLGGLFLIGRDDGKSVSTAETAPSTDETASTPPPVSDEDALQPVETLPDFGDVFESPVTVAGTEPTSWYRVAPDLDISWYSGQQGPSFFCWRTPVVAEPQCSVDPLGGSTLPLVAPTAGAQTLVLAGVDRTDPVLNVLLDDGTVLEATVDVDEVVDMGVARFALLPSRTVVSVGGQPVAEPISVEEYIPPFLLGFVGLDLADFTEQVAELGFTTRVVSQDGEGLDRTEDYDVNRINVATVDGKVTELFPVG